MWAIIMAVGLFTPGDKLPDRKLLHIENFDKILHLLIFGFLEFLLLLEMYLNHRTWSRKAILLTIFVALGYGVITEIIQYLFISERKGSFFDLFADLTGIMLALGFFMLTINIINRLFLRRL